MTKNLRRLRFTADAGLTVAGSVDGKKAILTIAAGTSGEAYEMVVTATSNASVAQILVTQILVFVD